MTAHAAVGKGNKSIAYYVEDAHTPSPPLLLIAGGPGVHHGYLRAGTAFEQIAKTRSLVFYDQRGTGNSALDTPSDNVDTFVDDILAVITALGVPRVDVIGHSFGGYLAMALVACAPHRVRKLVLASSMAARAADTVQLLDAVYPDLCRQWRDVRASLPDMAEESAFALYNQMALPDRQLREIYHAATAGHVVNVRINNQLRAHMQTLDFTSALTVNLPPTLILHGRRDVVIAPSVAWALHQQLLGSQLVWFETSGHLLFLEEPDKFVHAVNAFLA